MNNKKYLYFFLFFLTTLLFSSQLTFSGQYWEDDIYLKIIKHVMKSEKINPQLITHIIKNKEKYSQGLSVYVSNTIFENNNLKLTVFFDDIYNHLFNNCNIFLYSEYFGFFSRMVIDLFNPVEYNSGIIIDDKAKISFKKNMRALNLDLSETKIKNIESFKNMVKEELKINDNIINSLNIYNLPGIKDKSFDKIYMKNIINERLKRCTETLLSTWFKLGEDFKIDKLNDETVTEYFYLAQLYFRIKQFKHSERINREMLEKFPNHLIAYYSLATYYSETGKDDFASDVLFAYFEKNQNSNNKYFIITEPEIEMKNSSQDNENPVKYKKFGSIFPIISDIKKRRLELIEIEFTDNKKYFVKSTSGQIIDRYSLYLLLACNLDRLKGKSVLSNESKNIWNLLLNTRFDNIAKNRLLYGGR